MIRIRLIVFRSHPCIPVRMYEMKYSRSALENNSKIWEWLDIPVGKQERKILQLIANSKSAKVRYSGRQ